MTSVQTGNSPTAASDLNHFDAIVVGVGAVGGATLAALAEAGQHVLGLEQFQVGHDRGSSHGQTRVIRKAYFEHPAYVPLLRRAYTLWERLQHDTGRPLFERSGIVQVGPPEGDVIQGVLASAKAHDLDIQVLDPATLAKKAPMLGLPEGMVALLEADGGILAVEDCVRAQAQRAVRRGATLMQGETVQSWKSVGSHFEVQTQSDKYRADRLFLTGGAWMGSLLADLGARLIVRRKPLLWFEADRAWRSAPIFLYELPEGVFYGFPSSGSSGVKIAEHTGGDAADPDALDRSLRDTDTAPVQGFIRSHLRGLTAEALRSHSICMYTLTPDEHFCVGAHPQVPGLFMAAGLSGHGFKFAPVLGEVLAQLALGGSTGLDIDFLSPSRFLNNA